MAKKSRAVSSQNTHFYIQQLSGTATAKAITGISKAKPAVVTATGHGLKSGDVVTVDAVVGMTEINGTTAPIKVLTANTFELVGIDSTAFTTYGSAGTATPLVFLETCQHKSYSGFDGQASERDTTTSFYGKNQHHDTIHKLATDSGYKHVEKASALNNHVDTYHKELGDGRNVASISVHKSMNDPKHVTKVATQVKEKKW